MNLSHIYSSKGKRSKVYNSSIITFDMETTSLYKNSDGTFTDKPKPLYHDVKKKSGEIVKEHDEYECYGCMYHWQFCIDGEVIMGRSMDELAHTFLEIQQQPGIKLIWIHNLSFEFHWLNNIFYRSEFGQPNLKVFSRDPHKVMKAEWGTIEFRCTYFLTNMSLAKAAHEFRLPLEKMVGDLDYSKLRGYTTPLTHAEKGYCRVDAVLLYQLILKFIKIYGKPHNIPLTSTSRLRRECQKIMKEDLGARLKVREAYPQAELYVYLRQAFMGGYTHSNFVNTNMVLDWIDGYDIASSYPTVMVSEKFPMKFKKEENPRYHHLSSNVAYLYKVKLTNVRSKISMSYLSSSRCIECYKSLIDNGRIRECEYLIGWFTDIDVDVILENYDVENVEVLECWSAGKKYLPKPLLKFIFKLYTDKTKLKDVLGEEDAYAQSKAFINAMYGMTVTNDIRDEVQFDKGEFSVKALTMEEIEKELLNKSKSPKTFLLYQWGVWVTAYARRNLWRMIHKIDYDLVYTDTDSVKLINSEKYQKDFDEYNANITKKIQSSIKLNNLDVEYPPKDKFGRERPMGIYDHEKEYPVKQFKTLGAKKYAYIDQNDELHITISGVSKKAAKYLKNLDEFEEGKVFDETQSGRTISHYIYNQKPFTFTDYLGNEQTIDDQPFAICIEPTTYEIGLTEEYKSLLQQTTHLSILGERRVNQFG